jgi:hypothetical protein
MKRILPLLLLLAAFLLPDNFSFAQQYKLKQSTSVMGMNTSSTIYVKGMRKRTESSGMMGMPAPPVTIEQCDRQRTIKINDKKKLYFIEPFAKDNEEIIDEEVKTPPKQKPVTPTPRTATQKGGTITLYYNITDTGERKKMYGFTARHVWTTNKMKPSADACTMKDSMIIKTDGWYIDLPQFNCPVNYKRYNNPAQQGPMQKPDCMDKFVTRRSGKGKLGFPLIETTTIIMNDGKKKTSSFETRLETLEFSAAKLDSMLFEIPPGYTQTMNEEDLQEKMNIQEMMEQYGNGNMGNMPVAAIEEKQAGTIRIGVYPMQGEEQIQLPELQQHLAGVLNGDNIEGVVVADEAEAKKLNCDYSLTTKFVRIKQGSKVGGLLKAVKNADPNAASSFTIETNMTLVNLSNGSTTAQPKTDGKYEGKIADAAKKALDEGGRLVLKGVR